MAKMSSQDILGGVGSHLRLEGGSEDLGGAVSLTGLAQEAL